MPDWARRWGGGRGRREATPNSRGAPPITLGPRPFCCNHAPSGGSPAPGPSPAPRCPQRPRREQPRALRGPARAVPPPGLPQRSLVLSPVLPAEAGEKGEGKQFLKAYCRGRHSGSRACFSPFPPGAALLGCSASAAVCQGLVLLQRHAEMAQQQIQPLGMPLLALTERDSSRKESRARG